MMAACDDLQLQVINGDKSLPFSHECIYAIERTYQSQMRHLQPQEALDSDLGYLCYLAVMHLLVNAI